jgi:biopolymer transport protein ExbB
MNQTDTIDSQILDLMLRAGSRWVLWLLIALSLGALTVIAERIWFFIQEKKPADRLAAAMKALRDKGPEEALRLLKDQRSIEVSVVRACLEHAGEGAGSVDEVRAAIVEQERQRYERRLAFLGTLGNNAPFIGLFGTVLGIIRAFHDLSGSTIQNPQKVMGGIAEALVATGVGLLVALPAVATYNAFMRHVETASASAEAHAREVLAYMKKEAA